MELRLSVPPCYRLKRGQTLAAVARAFSVPPRLLAAENGLKEEPPEGTVLRIPPARGDLYEVRGGESKTLLCGSPAAFAEKNGTARLYIGQIVYL